MAAVADFGRKLDLVLKTFNLSRGRLAQTVGIDKSVGDRKSTRLNSSHRT